VSAPVSALDLLWTRRSVPLGSLGEPGPDDEQIAAIARAAVRVPDHGDLAPWRLVLVRGGNRPALGEALAARAAARAGASEAEVALWRRLPTLAPTLWVSVFSPRQSRVPEWEQILSCGASCQNLLLAAHALGFGAQWLTGWPAYDEEVARVLGMIPGERVAGFIFVGTAERAPKERPRPGLDQVLSEWRGPAPPLSSSPARRRSGP
jgi:nitroreductase